MKGRGKGVDLLRGRECGREHEVLLNRKVGPFVSDARSRRVDGATWSKLMIVGPTGPRRRSGRIFWERWAEEKKGAPVLCTG